MTAFSISRFLSQDIVFFRRSQSISASLIAHLACCSLER